MLLQKNDKIIIIKEGILLEGIPEMKNSGSVCRFLRKNDILAYLGQKKMRDVLTGKPKTEGVFQIKVKEGEIFLGTISQNCFNCFKDCKNLKPDSRLGKKCNLKVK